MRFVFYTNMIIHYLKLEINLYKFTGCLTKQLTHITWHNFVKLNVFFFIYFWILQDVNITVLDLTRIRYTDEKNIFCVTLYLGVKIIQKGAGKTQPKYNFNTFPSKPFICK